MQMILTINWLAQLHALHAIERANIHKIIRTNMFIQYVNPVPERLYNMQYT